MDLIKQQYDELFGFSGFGANRPLEFRAFHIPTHRMVLVDSFNAEFITPQPETEREVVEPLARVDCILMQRVGRQDANNQSIWEGDVVRRDHQHSTGLAYYFYQYVGYREGSFIFVDVNERIDVDTPQLNALVFDRISTFPERQINAVIVGNVYQDSHLLDLIGLIKNESGVTGVDKTKPDPDEHSRNQ